MLNKIKSFGHFCIDNFKFKKCPLKAIEDRKYLVSGEKETILTKNSKDGRYICALCINELEKSIEYKWKIIILKTKNYDIKVGVAKIDTDINSSSPFSFGWYFSCNNLNLLSGPPHNYSRKSNITKISNEILIVMNMKIGALKFIIDNEDKGYSYNDIPLDKPIVPAVILYNKDDMVEIIKC